MTAKHSAADFQTSTLPSASGSVTDYARDQIVNLVGERLVGRKIDGVGFVENLLQIATLVHEMICRPIEGGLRFQLADSAPFDVDLDGSNGKLRMLCARLAVLCQENGCEFMPYGGDGIIRQAAAKHPGGNWRVRWTNTTDKQEFTLSAEALPSE